MLSFIDGLFVDAVSSSDYSSELENMLKEMSKATTTSVSTFLMSVILMCLMNKV